MRWAMVLCGVMIACGEEPTEETGAPAAKATKAQVEMREMIPNGIEFIFVDSSRPMVGERLVFEKDGVRVVGLINANGAVRLPLDDGLWLVRGPEHISPDRVWVSEAHPTMHLTVAPRARVSGCVVDEAGRPVADARVHATGEPSADSVAVRRDGCFSFDADGPSVELQAFGTNALSKPTWVRVPSSDVSLVVVPVFPLKVRFESTELRYAYTSVWTRIGARSAGCESATDCSVLVPSGEFSAVVGGRAGGQRMWGRQSGMASAPAAEVFVDVRAFFDDFGDAYRVPAPPEPVIITEHAKALESHERGWAAHERPRISQSRFAKVYWSFPSWRITWAASGVQPQRTVLLGEERFETFVERR